MPRHWIVALFEPTHPTLHHGRFFGVTNHVWIASV